MRTFTLLVIFILSVSLCSFGIAWHTGNIPKPWLQQAQQLTSQYVSPSLAKMIDPPSTNSDSTVPPAPDQTPAPSTALATQPNAPTTPTSGGNTLATAPPDALQFFGGLGNFTSAVVTIPDRTEVDWDSPGGLTITRGNANGTSDDLITVQSGPSHGSFFQPKGGNFCYKISGPRQWVVWIVAIPGGAPPVLNTLAPVPPQHLGGGSASSDYKAGIVIVRGSNASGTGFIARMGGQTYVFTNQHVVFDNPNLTFQTNSGSPLDVIGFEGAPDRDLARFTVRDDGTLPAVPLCANVASNAHPGDGTVISGNSQGGGVVVDTPGTIVGIGPVKVEVSNPIFPGNSGSPVMDKQLNQAVGVITEAEKSETEGWLNASSLANPNSAIQSVRYYSLRLDNVPAWEAMDMSTFYQQTHFLTAFHQKSLEIISFIKYLESLSPDGSQAQADDGISTTLYQHNAELVGLLQTFKEDAGKVSVDADLSFAEQKFTVSLAGIASSDLQTASNTAGFYGFNRIRAKQEADLRKQVVEGCNKMSRLVANMKY